MKIPEKLINVQHQFFLYNTDNIPFSVDSGQNVLPTIGFRTVSLKHKSYSVKIYDLGGSFQIRPLWPKYYNDVSDLRFKWITIAIINAMIKILDD